MALDKYGNAVEEAAYETFDGYTEKVGGVKYDYVYDDNGNPLELVVSVYDYESDEYFLDQKFVYDGYSDVAAGIDGVLSSCEAECTIIGTLYPSRGTLYCEWQEALLRR